MKSNAELIERFLEKRYSIPQVARMLSVSTGKVRRWIESGELRATNLADDLKKSPQYSISYADLIVFEDSRKGSKSSRTISGSRKPSRRTRPKSSKFF